MSRVRIDFEWLGEGGETPDEATMARLGIWIDQDCLTRNRSLDDPQEPPGDMVVGSLAGLADWLIENWTSLHWEVPTPFARSKERRNAARFPGAREALHGWPDFEEVEDPAILADWQHRHLLGHGGSDLALPSIVLAPEWRHTVLAVDHWPEELDPTVRFLGPGDMPRGETLHPVRKQDFSSEIRRLVESVLTRAAATKFSEWSSWLRSRWDEALADEKDPALRRRRMFGEVVADHLARAEKEKPLLAGALRQFFIDCPPIHEPEEAQKASERLEDLLGRRRRTADPRWKKIDLGRFSSNQPPYDQGYQMARIVRQILRNEDQPIVELSDAFRELDVDLLPPERTRLFRTAACAAEGEGYILRSASDEKMNHLPSARFALAAAFGRLLWHRDHVGSTRCVAHGDYARWFDTARANAFAAELLLPTKAVRRRSLRPEDAGIGEWSERYGISKSAACHHIENVV